ncbi:PA2778 family cysteine peptidase [Stutzerimonas azotifigens]|uniref:PA2778 family cysteine peptidase n=1 Tax=Stutzerimonas azotifigens TaxID=291995 RepID=UPI0003F99D01|nr:PA2778 family cysteine peptidase [Stutzerimonas azotifigens]
MGRALALILVVLLGGCAGAPVSRLDDSGLPRRAELGDTPFYPQQAYQCGPAALATLLVQRGRDTGPEALVDQVYLPGRQGSLQVEMVAAARSHGLLVYPLKPRLETLFAEVAAGNPVLVLQNLAFERWPQWHFAVVVGYDLDKGEVILRSGTTRRRVESLSAFAGSWEKGERWAVITVEPDVFPATAERLPWLRAAADLETTGHSDEARTAYEQAVRRWGDGTSWFALGNNRHARGDLAGAEQALVSSVQADRTFAPAWFNLAHVLAGRACETAADAALGCARRLAPEDARMAAALPQAQGGARGGAPACPVLPACP